MANASAARAATQQYTTPAPDTKASNFTRKHKIAKHSGADLEDVLQILDREHEYIDSLLETLDQEAARLKPGRIPDFHLLLDIVHYLIHYPDQYHHPREELLFNNTLERDPHFQSKLDHLLREHETLHRYNDQLFNELSAVARGASADRGALLESIERYIECYRQHMAYESTEIFPQARGKLKATDLHRLAERTRYLDDPLFGGGVHERYRRLERQLRARIGAVGAELVNRELSVIESVITHAAAALDRLNHLRENLPAVRFPTGHAGLNPFGARVRLAQRPSWQARTVNTCFRVLVKPLMQFGSIESMRNLTSRMDEKQEQSQPEDIRIQAANAATYRGEWVRIAGKRARHTLLYFPGGGFVMRTKVQHRAFVARICRAAHAKAFVVHYRLAPETPFPGGLEDCLAAYHDLLRQKCDPANITIAGDSAGGGLVLSTLLALRDEGSPMPANAIVLSPLADLTYSGESRRFNSRKDPMIPNHRASHIHELYMGEAVPEDRYLSPVLADFEGLPPILGQVGSTEVLLDDTVRAAARAKKAQVPFHLEIWNEMPHCFPLFAMLPEGQVAVERIAEFMIRGELDALPQQYGSSDPDSGRPGHIGR